VEEHCHFMALLPFMLRLACTLIVPVPISAPHALMATMRFTSFTASDGSLSANFACRARHG
jgi:hypothetical protein